MLCIVSRSYKHLMWTIYQASLRRGETKLRRDLTTDTDKQRMIATSILRMVFSMTSLIDTSEFFEVALHIFPLDL